LNENIAYRIYKEPKLQASSLIVGWNEDAGNLGDRVIKYLNEKLGCEEFGEIEPVEFFPLGGVSVEDDVAHFPESKFYSCPKKNLVLFKSNAPRAEWHKFLNTILNVAEQYCHTTEVYTIGGMVALSAHTSTRELFAISNSPKMKIILGQYNLNNDMDYVTPPEQRPTISSFLLWVARNRALIGASLWVPLPFYLLATEDPAACKRVVEFFDTRFNLGIDLSDLDIAVKKQNEKIASMRFSFPEIDKYIRNLESNVALSQEESEKLVKEIEEYLKRIE
jgi:predicted ATP-grasp superfamily ATP-dependent carboligase